MKFQSIQTLRAVAALMVMVMHARIAVYWATDLWYIPGISDNGALGVNLFFCISGFIICHVVSKNDFRPGVFLLKRAWRIVPLYWIVMGLGLWFCHTDRFFLSDLERLGDVGMLKSFLIFPQVEHPFIAPGWSLEHEIIFYALAALVVPFARVRGLFLTVLALWFVGRFYKGWDYHLFADAHIYFAGGIASYWLRKADPKVLLSVAAACLAVAYGDLYKLVALGSFWVAVLFSAGFSALIAGLVSLEYKGLTFPRWLVGIGNASFSIYLVHWIVLPWIGLAAYYQGGSLEGWRWVAVAASLAAGLLSYNLIERPLMAFAHWMEKSNAGRGGAAAPGLPPSSVPLK